MKYQNEIKIKNEIKNEKMKKVNNMIISIQL